MSDPVQSQLSLLPREDTPFGMVYATKSGRAAVDVLSLPTVDPDTMSVLMRISTDAVDRERMVIRQEGISTEHYVSNPAVLYGHGEQGIVLPVAMSEDDDGNCTVYVAEDGTYARAFHKSMDKTSSQMFDAVNCGLLRASSVGVTPQDISIRYGRDGEKIPVVESCWLNEWSYCTVGVNPESVIMKSLNSSGGSLLLTASALQCDAAIRILNRGTLDGAPILPSIKKALLGLQPKARATSLGHDFKGSQMTKKLQADEIQKMTRGQLMKSLTKMMEYDEPTQKMLAEAGDEIADDLDTTPADGPMDESADEEKQGSSVTRAGYDSLIGAVEMFRSEIGRVEDEAYVAKITSQIDAIADALEAIAGYHAEKYPDAPKIAMDEIDPDADILKSMWAVNESRRVSAAHAVSRINTMASRIESGKFDPKVIAGGHRSIAKSLSRMLAEAGEVKVVSAADHESLQAKYEKSQALLGKAEDVLKQLDGLPATV